MIEIRRGMTQNDLAGSQTNLMINGLHIREFWSVGVLEYWSMVKNMQK